MRSTLILWPPASTLPAQGSWTTPVASTKVCMFHITLCQPRDSRDAGPCSTQVDHVVLVVGWVRCHVASYSPRSQWPGLARRQRLLDHQEQLGCVATRIMCVIASNLTLRWQARRGPWTGTCCFRAARKTRVASPPSPRTPRVPSHHADRTHAPLLLCCTHHANHGRLVLAVHGGEGQAFCEA